MYSTGTSIVLVGMEAPSTKHSTHGPRQHRLTSSSGAPRQYEEYCRKDYFLVPGCTVHDVRMAAFFRGQMRCLSISCIVVVAHQHQQE